EDFAEAWARRGAAYHGLREYDKALEAFSKAIELEKDLAEAWAGRGYTYRHLRQYDKALYDYSQALKCKSDYAMAHCNLAVVLQTQGGLVEGLVAARRGHELGTKQPDWPHPSAAWVRQAELLVKLEKRLPAVVRGEDKFDGALERLQFAQLCYFKQL